MPPRRSPRNRAASMAARTAAVSSFRPSPMAPNARTLNQGISPGPTDGVGVRKFDTDMSPAAPVVSPAPNNNASIRRRDDLPVGVTRASRDVGRAGADRRVGVTVG